MSLERKTKREMIVKAEDALQPRGEYFFTAKMTTNGTFMFQEHFIHRYAAVKVPLIHHYSNKEWKQRESMLYARNDGMNIS